MAPAFFSTDLDRTSKFWGALGFVEVRRYPDHGYIILEHPKGIVIHFGLDPDLVANFASVSRLPDISRAREGRVIARYDVLLLDAPRRVLQARTP